MITKKYKDDLFFLAIVASVYSSYASSEEVVTTSAVGISDTKRGACEQALDTARVEAAQTAITFVNSEIKSTSNNSGISAISSTSQTTKAYAKVVEKQENTSYDSESGKITCKVTATFRSGFVNTDITDSSVATGGSSKAIADFRAGEVFCSKIMQSCFREIYTPQLDVFGIQYLGGKANRGNSYYYMLFTEATYNTYKGREKVKIDTREKFLKFVRDKFESTTLGSVVLFDVNAYIWSNNTGFDYDAERTYLSGLGKGDIGILTPTPSIKKERVEALDKKMREVYESIESIY